MWDFTIRETTFEELAPLRYSARNEVDVAFKRDTKNTIWFLVDVEGDMVACAGIISVRNNYEVVRFKAGYTLPEWRGQGFGNAIVDHMIWYTETKLPQCVEMQVFTTSPPFYAAKGWEFMGRSRPSEMHRFIDRSE